MRSILICLITVLIFISADAQEEKIKFTSITSGGIAVGEIGTFLIVQTVNGVQYKKWFAGIGAGYDSYYYKTIPLFLDAKRFINKQNNIFVYGDGGYNISWKNKPKEISRYSSYNFSGGFYGDIGIGYKAKFIKKTFILITTGYSYKRLYNKVEIVYPCLVGPCPENMYDYTYNFRRIIFKTGIMF